MRTIEFTLQEVTEYYQGDFQKHLRQYFDIVQRNNKNCILFMDAFHNQDRLVEGQPAHYYSRLSADKKEVDETKLNFIFAGIFYFMVLVPRRLRSLFGDDTATDFYLATGWPWTSCGLGGFLTPKQTLSEAHLYPIEVEKANYITMMNVVGPFMLHEIKDFISESGSRNLNQAAFDRLYRTTSDKVDLLLADLQEQTNSFIEQL
jgi:hypothetical protein